MADESNEKIITPEAQSLEYKRHLTVGETELGLLTDVKWRFQNPYHAGMTIGLLVKVLADNFARNNPELNKEGQARTLMLEGILDTLNSEDFKTATVVSHDEAPQAPTH